MPFIISTTRSIILYIITWNARINMKAVLCLLKKINIGDFGIILNE
jgi:hypothetical protein